jgi:tripartite-type tricarboxylate transporter receptor subunit TctC
MAGVDMVHVLYKAGGPAMISLLSGQVQVMFATAASVAPYVKSGRLMALAVTRAKPSALVPSLPTVAETLPGYDTGGATAMFAPPKTPPPVISQLNREIVRLLNQADVREQFLRAGVETVGSSPEELAATVSSDMKKWAKVIKEAGIHAD